MQFLLNMSELLARTCVCIYYMCVCVCTCVRIIYVCMRVCGYDGGRATTHVGVAALPQIQKKKYGHCFGIQLCSVSVRAVVSVFCPFSYLISHCLFIAIVVP